MRHSALPPLLLLLLALPATAAHAELAELSVERKQEIATIVQQDCGSCHGLTLKGGLGPSLDPQRLRQFPDNFLTLTIQHGRPGTPMPPWGPLFTTDEIRHIAEQLRAGTWYVP
jgi:cytochrome c55X